MGAGPATAASVRDGGEGTKGALRVVGGATAIWRNPMEVDDGGRLTESDG